MAVLATVSIAVSVAYALTPTTATVPVNPALASSTQFDVTGFLQDAKLDQTCVAAANAAANPLDAQGNPKALHCGGTATVNGLTITIPSELVVILPASALTWAQLFTEAPAPYTNVATGMAIDDSPKPATTFEFNIIGNRVITGGQDRMIAGLVHVSQQDLNSGAGYINFIDYTDGSIYVGGTTKDATTGTRVKINDPSNPTALDQNGAGGSGRFGRPNDVDPRFQVDQDNPTIEAETGFPMCVPRTNPYTAEDPQCPEANRPRVKTVGQNVGVNPNPNTLAVGDVLRIFRMDDPANIDSINAGQLCTFSPCADPRKQAPFEIGDYISFAGNLVNTGAQPTADAPGVSTYILAHTIVDSLGIYTTTGVDPAYVTVEVTILGTGGLTVFGAGEAAVRTRFEGMSTDESRQIDLYGIDINPKTGVTTDREWGSVMPDPGPPGGAVRGRWRFRPPCTLTPAAVAANPGKNCSPPPAGQFIPPTREVRAVIHGHSEFYPLGTLDPNPNSQVPGTDAAATAANGIYWGQYHAPIGEYIFPENVPGSAVPENNFNTMPFLAYGGYASVDGVQVGVLNPWPSNVNPPALACAVATLVGAPYSVANGGSVQLSGAISSDTPGVPAAGPVSIGWAAGTTPGGTDLSPALTGANTTTPTFSAAGLAAGVYNVSFTVDNICGSSTVASTITVQAAPAPSIKPIQNQTVTAGTPVTIVAQSSDLPLPTFAWTQTGGPGFPVTKVAINPVPSAATPTATSSFSFNATAAGTYTFSVTAHNANGTSSPVTVSVTATAATQTNITFGGTLEYRTSKQRLVMTATSTDATITGMTLMPYLTESGTTFDPASLGAGLSISLITPGSWTITLVGAPRPACNLNANYATPCAQRPITVKGIKNGAVVGTSAASALDKIRQ